MAQRTVFINGEAASAVEVGDRGLAYGHGIFETMRIADAKIPLLSYHCARLMHGVEVLGISLPKAVIADEITAVLAQIPDSGVLKLLVTAGAGGRGYSAACDLVPCRIYQWFPSPEVRPPAQLQVCSYTLPHNPVLAGLKHLNRLDQVLAARELRDDHQGLVLDVGGNVIEAISQNLFMRCDGLWITPDLSQCGVSGVMRQVLMKEVFPQIGDAVDESSFDLDRLLGCDELFLCNAVMGIQPVGGVGDGPRWNSFAKTRKIQAVLEERYPCFTA